MISSGKEGTHFIQNAGIVLMDIFAHFRIITNSLNAEGYAFWNFSSFFLSHTSLFFSITRIEKNTHTFSRNQNDMNRDWKSFGAHQKQHLPMNRLEVLKVQRIWRVKNCNSSNWAPSIISPHVRCHCYKFGQVKYELYTRIYIHLLLI